MPRESTLSGPMADTCVDLKNTHDRWVQLKKAIGHKTDAAFGREVVKLGIAVIIVLFCCSTNRFPRSEAMGDGTRSAQ